MMMVTTCVTEAVDDVAAVVFLSPSDNGVNGGENV